VASRESYIVATAAQDINFSMSELKKNIMQQFRVLAHFIFFVICP